MRRMLAALVLCLLFLCGCGRRGKPLFDPVYFYYPRVDFYYGDPDGVITWEAMDGTGHMEDYAYLMAEYFRGPIDEGLYNPFPQGTELLHAQVEDTSFSIELSTKALELPEHQFALGCACLSMTCFELTEVHAVTISCGGESTTIERGEMLLSDDYIPDFKDTDGG